MANGVSGETLDTCLAIPAGAQQLRQGLGISGICFVSLQGCSSTSMARVQAYDGKAESFASTTEPRRQVQFPIQREPDRGHGGEA